MARDKSISYDTEYAFFQYKESLENLYYLITYGYEIEEKKLVAMLVERTTVTKSSWKTFMLTGLFSTLPRGEFPPFNPTEMQLLFEEVATKIIAEFKEAGMVQINYFE